MTLLATFADQAVIAIENVRLFDEVQAKTRDLSEALTYQTGSANILKVIASSPTDVAAGSQGDRRERLRTLRGDDAASCFEGWRRLFASARITARSPMQLGEMADQPRWIAGRALLDRQAGACARHAFGRRRRISGRARHVDVATADSHAPVRSAAARRRGDRRDRASPH